ncbi:MAG: hypothetical protein NC252_05775 [Roseburia sp.]|nr:hypothetical protein [Roseburia sp.]MCM1420485.1 hypothetical protein [Bacteroides sp.]
MMRTDIREDNTEEDMTAECGCGCHCEDECHCCHCKEKEPDVFDESDIEDFIANLNDWD